MKACSWTTVDWANSGATGLTKVFSTTEGNITAHMTGVGSSLGARDRGAGGQLTCCLRPVQQDFAFAQRDTTLSPPVGRNYIKLELSGLTPNETYRFTGFAREAAFQDARLLDPDDPTQSFQAWTDLAALGGIDGPAAWLDSNGLGPAGYDPAVGGVNNPIPTLRRSQTAGPDSLSDANPFFHSATFDTTADGGGVVTLYTWADPNGYASDTQGATLLNGFQLAPIPEPSAGILLGIAIACFAKVRRRN